jgi:hypothetical protein
MPTCRNIRLALGLLSVIVSGGFGCQSGPFQKQPDKPLTVRDVPAVRLNYRYEADVPPPTEIPGRRKPEERNAGVQSDFDTNRPQELLDSTLNSPDKKHVLAIYHRIGDTGSEFRLDMYSPEGKAERKLTSDTMAVHFPETIVWSPDSGSLAFVAMIRAQAVLSPLSSGSPGSTPAVRTQNQANTAVNSDASTENTDVETETPAVPAAPTPAPPTGILTFRTEQIYIASADGSSVKPITENEGLIYFYYTWSPDSTMLAALATTSREWRYLELTAESKKELMVPQGRPRVIEKNGRERRLDDAPTAVHPVWSPDSTKVAAAFENQVRVYDASGTNPTQAAIPLRNQLLISSAAYDQNLQKQSQEANATIGDNTVSNLAGTPDQQLSMLPNEKDLVSYNPIVEIAWAQDDLLYLETAYVKHMKNEADNVTSFARWHRLVFTPQGVSTGNRTR